MKKIALVLAILMLLTFICSCDLKTRIDEMSKQVFDMAVQVAGPYLKEDSKFADKENDLEIDPQAEDGIE